MTNSPSLTPSSSQINRSLLEHLKSFSRWEQVSTTRELKNNSEFLRSFEALLKIIQKHGQAHLFFPMDFDFLFSEPSRLFHFFQNGLLTYRKLLSLSPGDAIGSFDYDDSYKRCTSILIMAPVTLCCIRRSRYEKLKAFLGSKTNLPIQNFLRIKTKENPHIAKLDQMSPGFLSPREGFLSPKSSSLRSSKAMGNSSFEMGMSPETEKSTGNYADKIKPNLNASSPFLQSHQGPRYFITGTFNEFLKSNRPESSAPEPTLITRKKETMTQSSSSFRRPRIMASLRSLCKPRLMSSASAFKGKQTQKEKEKLTKSGSSFILSNDFFKKQKSFDFPSKQLEKETKKTKRVPVLESFFSDPLIRNTFASFPPIDLSLKKKRLLFTENDSNEGENSGGNIQNDQETKKSFSITRNSHGKFLRNQKNKPETKKQSETMGSLSFFERNGSVEKNKSTESLIKRKTTEASQKRTAEKRTSPFLIMDGFGENPKDFSVDQVLPKSQMKAKGKTKEEILIKKLRAQTAIEKNSKRKESKPHLLPFSQSRLVLLRDKHQPDYFSADFFESQPLPKDYIPKNSYHTYKKQILDKNHRKNKK